MEAVSTGQVKSAVSCTKKSASPAVFLAPGIDKFIPLFDGAQIFLSAGPAISVPPSAAPGLEKLVIVFCLVLGGLAELFGGTNLFFYFFRGRRGLPLYFFL